MSADKNSPTRKQELGTLVDPGADARTKLVQAGLEAFGMYNFEGATTRDLARMAGVNLAAIPYHFGGKKALYQAVVEYITDHIFEQAGADMGNAAEVLAAEDASWDQLLEGLTSFLESIAAAMLLSPEARYWARIMLREQMMPTEAFDIIYDRTIGPAHVILTGLTARLSGLPQDSPEARVRAFTLLGQVLVFRAVQASVKRRMHWPEVDTEAFQIIRNVIHENVAAILRQPRSLNNGDSA